MKRMVPTLSLMQQAVLALSLGVASALLWFLQPFFRSHLHTSSLTLRMIVYIVFMIGGFIASIWISFHLRTGIESGRWPDAEIDRFRATFGKSSFLALTLTIALAAILVLLFELVLSRLRHAPNYGYGLLFLSQVLSQFSMATHRPRPKNTNQPIDWRNSSPMTSDHWGQQN